MTGQTPSPGAVWAATRLYPSALGVGGWYLLAPSWPVEGRPVLAPPPPHLTPILQELLNGATDATASRRLNMSTRTFNRRVADLLANLGVETRFQGGAEAVLRGWIPALSTEGERPTCDDGREPRPDGQPPQERRHA